METKDLKIGSLVYHKELGVTIVITYMSDNSVNAYHLGDEDKKDFYYVCWEIEPISISEEYLLGFGFKKVEETHEDYTDVLYQLEEKDVFFSYADDWSLAIADNKRTFDETGNYIVIDTSLTNKVHLWQNLFYSLTGKEIHENKSV
jgi:hypothetical protein